MQLQVSKRLRAAQVVCSVFFCLTTAGVIFGYAALKPVLVRKGVYRELCDDEDDGWPACSAQDLRLNYMFTLSAVVTNTFALPIGILLDYAGPRNTALLGAVCFALGNFAFGLQIVNSHVDTYFIGFILLAIGGPLIFLSQFHIQNTFPKNSGLVLSCIIGAFDCSSVPFLIYRGLDNQYDIPIRTWFWAYIAIPALLVVQQLILAPRTSYKPSDFEDSAPILTAPPSSMIVTPLPLADEGDTENPMRTLLRRRSSARPSFGAGFATKTVDPNERPIIEQPAHFDDPLMGAMADLPVKRQLMSSYFVLIVFFLCVYMCRINYEIQTITSQLVFYLHDVELADQVSTAFTVLLPLGGVIGIPIIGSLLDNYGSGVTSMVVIVMGLAYGLLGILPYTLPQLLSIAIFVVLRPLMYTFMGDYTGKAFGFETFGTVYGLLNCTAGLFGLVLRPIDLLVKGPLHGNYTIVNVAGVLLGVVSATAITWRIYRKPRGEVALVEEDEEESGE